MTDFKNVSREAQNPDNFWHYAKRIRTYRADDPRAKTIRAHCNIKHGLGSLKTARLFEHPETKEQRWSVELKF